MDRAAALRKVAVVIESVDGPTAETLLAQLPPERAALVRQTLLQLGPVERAERDDVLAEFLRGHAQATTVSPAPVAAEPATAACPADQCEPVAEPLEPSRSEPLPFAFLDGVAPQRIAGCLADEHPQTSSVVLAHLPPATAAEVLQHLPAEQQVDVLQRIARLERTDPAVLAEIDQTLQQTWRHRLRAAAAPPIGVAAVEAILGAGGLQDRPALMALLEQRDPQLLRRLGYAERLDGLHLAVDTCADQDHAAWDRPTSRRPLAHPRPLAAPAGTEPATGRLAPCSADDASSRDALDFEDLIALDDSALATIFRAADPHVALLALTGASPQLAERMLGQLPGREASELARQMEALGPIRLQDVACAQQRIAELVRQLARQGTLQLPQARYFTEAAQLLRIIKAHAASAPPEPRVGATPGFVDLSDELQLRLGAAEAEAARILEQARADAERLRREAEQQGLHAAREAARQQAREELATQLESALPALRQTIESLQQARADQLRQGERHVVRLAIAIAQRLIRRELQQAPDIALSLIREALELAANSDRITLHLHPRDHQSLHAQLARLTALPEGTRSCEVVADPAVEPGACVVQTEFGTIDQQFQTQLKRIEEELLP